MSRRPGSIPALTRWRAFGEARASVQLQRESFAVRQASWHLDEARARLEDVSQSWSALLNVANIDLPRLQITAQIEQAAAEHLQARRSESAAAHQTRDEAQAVFVAARAETRVAGARGDRHAAAERGRLEKVLFDWMADLHAQNERTSR